MYTIDIERGNYSPIFSCGLGDTRTDEFKITRNGQPVVFVNPTVELNAKKKDGNTVHQTSGITYENGVFRVKYDIQFFTCKSVGEAEFVIIDQERTTTARFYFYVRDTIAEGIIGSITDEYLKTAYKELEAENVKLNIVLNENEAVRLAAEQARKDDEVNRVEAETERAAAEVNREKRVQEVEKKIEVNTSQLAEKANKNDVAKISSGTPLFATSVAGMTDTTKNYVNTTDGYLYLYSSGSWVKSAVKYQELGLSDGQVTPRKVSFLHVSENLFNKNDNNILTDKRISGSEGGDTATTIGSLVSGFIEIELNKQYAYSFDKGFYGGSCTYALYDNGNNLLELKNATVNDTYATFTVINQNAKKVRVNVSKRTVNTFVFNEGNTLVNYEDYGNACMTINVGLTNKQKEEVVNMVGQNVPNVLVGKKLISDGDSICYGSGFVGGYTKIIAENNNMQYTNYGVSGGTITAGTMAGTSNRHWVCRSIQSMDSNADYILLEGGVNDASMQVTIGEISNGYTATLNDMTFCGAFESMLKQALVKWAGKKIGFIITHHMEDRFYMYREKIILMCEKWGVPYLDLYTLCPPFYYIPELRKAYTKPYTSDPNDSDGWHPNEEGYRKYYAPKIEAWMKTL